LDIVELDKDGRQLNTRQLALQQKGFAVGNLVASSGAATVYIYMYIDREIDRYMVDRRYIAFQGVGADTS
jgi:hypothetical protein